MSPLSSKTFASHFMFILVTAITPWGLDKLRNAFSSVLVLVRNFRTLQVLPSKVTFSLLGQLIEGISEAYINEAEHAVSNT